MSRPPFTLLATRTRVLPQANIDTDQIIPARFLTTTERSGLGRHLFADWRAGATGAARADSPFDAPDSPASPASGAATDHQALVAGANFGCGSSREHAVWALADFGFRAVISSRLADIFRRNALGNGLLALEVDSESHAALLAAPGAEVEIDLVARQLRGVGRVVGFEIEPFARHCLLEGIDELDYLLRQRIEIAAFEAAHPLPELRPAEGIG